MSETPISMPVRPAAAAINHQAKLLLTLSTLVCENAPYQDALAYRVRHVAENAKGVEQHVGFDQKEDATSLQRHWHALYPLARLIRCSIIGNLRVCTELEASLPSCSLQRQSGVARQGVSSHLILPLPISPPFLHVHPL
jgi:hypothetical protein